MVWSSGTRPLSWGNSDNSGTIFSGTVKLTEVTMHNAKSLKIKHKKHSVPCWSVTISPCFSYSDMLTVAIQGEQEKLFPGEPARPRFWLGAAGSAPPRWLRLARRPAVQGEDASHRSAPLSLIFYYKYILMDWFYGDRVSNFPQPKLSTSWLTLR